MSFNSYTLIATLVKVIYVSESGRKCFANAARLSVYI